jgi:hypothetical protein
MSFRPVGDGEKSLKRFFSLIAGRKEVILNRQPSLLVLVFRDFSAFGLEMT